MALLVSDVMSRKIFTVSPAMEAAEVIEHLLTRGMTAAPVVDEDEQVMGLVSLRDLIDMDGRYDVRDSMSTQAVLIRPEETLQQAASRLADTGLHHLVVIDAHQRAIGVLSALEVMRGLIGLPATMSRGGSSLRRRHGLSLDP